MGRVSCSPHEVIVLNAIALLHNDHRTVEELFQGALKAPNQAEQRPLAERLIRELSIHAAIEELHLYPEVSRRIGNGKRVVEHSLEEHHEVKTLCAELDKMLDQAGTAPFTGKLEALRGAVQHHVDEEESSIFPELRSVMSEADLVELGTKLSNAKTTAPTRPHPHAPDKGPANVVVGIAAATIDRMRDAAEGRGEK